MSISEQRDEWPEALRGFVYEGKPEQIATALTEGCIIPALTEIKVQLGSVDLAIVHGQGGEMIRYVYYQGLQRSFDDPPLKFSDARNIIIGYSNFSSTIPPREHIGVVLLGAVSCAYEKGFNSEFGKI